MKTDKTSRAIRYANRVVTAQRKKYTRTEKEWSRLHEGLVKGYADALSASTSSA